jgi:hypothetical protein
MYDTFGRRYDTLLGLGATQTSQEGLRYGVGKAFSCVIPHIGALLRYTLT